MSNKSTEAQSNQKTTIAPPSAFTIQTALSYAGLNVVISFCITMALNLWVTPLYKIPDVPFVLIYLLTLPFILGYQKWQHSVKWSQYYQYYIAAELTNIRITSAQTLSYIMYPLTDTEREMMYGKVDNAKDLA